MKKVIQPEKHQTFCDIKRKEIKYYKNHLSAELAFDLLFYSKDKAKAITQELQWGDYSKNAIKDAIDESAYEEHTIKLDLCEDAALEVFKFLLRKYPKQMKKVMKDQGNYDFTVPVKSDWDKIEQ